MSRPSQASVKVRSPEPTLMLTVEEAARELRIARRRVYEMAGDGTLRSVKIGKSRRIPREALLEYVAGLSA